MRLKCRKSVEDVVAFALFSSRCSRTIKRMRIVYGALAPVGIFLLFCVGTVWTRRWEDPFVGALIAGLLAFWNVGRWRRNIEKHGRRITSEGTDRSRCTEYEIELARDALVVRDEAGLATHRYDRLERLGFTPDFTFIFTRAAAGYPVAKAGVLDGDYDAFGAELKSRIIDTITEQGPERDKALKYRIILDPKPISRKDRGFGGHSGPGIASFALALGVVAICGLALALTVALAVIAPELAQRESPLLRVCGAMIVFAVFANVAGIALAVAGIIRRGRKRVFAILGLVLNCLILAAMFALGAMAR